tara:strand:- start:976 stop:1593 length:618 start_codon:yes stop_codon:yes gene_type:complete
MPEFKIHNLWPIPVYEGEIPVKEKWKVLTKGLKYERTHIDNSDISIDRNVLNSIPDLKEDIQNHCERYIKKYLKVSDNAKFYLLNSWSNIHSSGEKSQIHYHGNSLLSGVYYPILPKNSGNISFHKSGLYTNTFHQSILFDYDEETEVNCGQYSMEIKEGTIIIFPSHLEHSVERNKSNENRYSIAFNFYVKGKFGKEEYTLEIK